MGKGGRLFCSSVKGGGGGVQQCGGPGEKIILQQWLCVCGVGGGWGGGQVLLQQCGKTHLNTCTCVTYDFDAFHLL